MGSSASKITPKARNKEQKSSKKRVSEPAPPPYTESEAALDVQDFWGDRRGSTSSDSTHSAKRLSQEAALTKTRKRKAAQLKAEKARIARRLARESVEAWRLRRDVAAWEKDIALEELNKGHKKNGIIGSEYLKVFEEAEEAEERWREIAEERSEENERTKKLELEIRKIDLDLRALKMRRGEREQVVL